MFLYQYIHIYPYLSQDITLETVQEANKRPSVYVISDKDSKITQESCEGNKPNFHMVHCIFTEVFEIIIYS